MTPDSLYPIIRQKFAKAQATVAIYCPDAGDPYAEDIRVELFKWEKMSGPFKCGEVPFKVKGCFSTPNHIQYASESSLWHEAGHAILFTLGSKQWRCSFGGHSYDYCK